MKQYLSTTQLKARARMRLFGRYSSVVGAVITLNLIMTFCLLIMRLVLPSGIAGIVMEYILYIIFLLFYGLFNAGNAFLYLNLACGNPVSSRMIFYSFRNSPDKALIVQLNLLIRFLTVAAPYVIVSIIYEITKTPVLLVFIGLTAVIMIIGVAYFALLYFPAFYMLHDFPDYDVKTIMDTSEKVMKGHMGKALYLYLGFIPMKLISLVSFGLASLWIDPYISASMTEYYLDLMRPQQVDITQ